MPGQIWATNSVGGFMYNDELSAKMRMALQPLTKFRQFADAKDATNKGLHKGQLYHWNVYSNVATQGTTLTETNTMPETNFTITQGTVTITEYGNSVPFTQKLESLAEHDVQEVVNKALKNDAVKAFDIGAEAEFNKSPLRAAGTATNAIALTSNSTAAGSGVAYNSTHAKLIIDQMKERNITPYTGDDYYAIAHPTTLRTFKNNLETLHQYTESGFRMIMNGEIGRYENTRYVEQTNIAKDGTTSTDWIYFFGEDTVAEAIAIPEEVRAKIPGDYGRSHGIAWLTSGNGLA